MLPSGGNLWFWLLRKIFQHKNLLGIIENIVFYDNIDLNLNHRCIFPLIDFLGSWSSFINWFVSRNSERLFVYLVLFINIAPRPLSCLRMPRSCLRSYQKVETGGTAKKKIKIASPFHCCPMNPECLWKKTQIEKKKETVETLKPLFIENIHIMTCIYIGSRLHQSVGKEGHWSR